MLLPSRNPALYDLESLKESICSGEAWVFQTPELKLNICFTSTHELHVSLSHLVSEIGGFICKAKLWSELGLSVIFKSCIHTSENSVSTFRSSFGIQKQLKPLAGTKTAKTPNILRDLGDTDPPPSVQTACITSIDVFLAYDYHPRCVQKYTTSFAIPIVPPEGLQNKSDVILQTTELDNFRCNELPIYSVNTSTDDEDGKLIYQDGLGRTGEDWDVDCCTVSETSRLLELGTLCQAALRTLIWGELTQNNHKNQQETGNFQGLSTIAPSVFKHHYRHAMNQRSRLIPSITKSISSMLDLSSSQFLKGKLATLKASHNSRTNPLTPIPTSNSSNDTRIILKASFWRSAQKRLYNTDPPHFFYPHSGSYTFLAPNSNQQSPAANLFPETPTEGTPCLNDDYDDDDDICFYESDFYLVSSPDSDSKEFEEFNITSKTDSDSMLSLGDDHTFTHPSAGQQILENLDLEFDRETITRPHPYHESAPASIEGSTGISPSKHGLSPCEYLESTENDHEMLFHDHDDDCAEDAPSSQTSLSYCSHLFAPGESEGDDSDYMLCEDL